MRKVSAAGSEPRVHKEEAMIAVRRLIVSAAWKAISFQASHRRRAGGTTGHDVCMEQSVRPGHLSVNWLVLANYWIGTNEWCRPPK